MAEKVGNNVEDPTTIQVEKKTLKRIISYCNLFRKRTKSNYTRDRIINELFDCVDKDKLEQRIVELSPKK